VWFGNTRGNTYSRRNVNGLYTYQAEFWYFSIDQLALIDLPTMIDFVLGKTRASKLALVGHSQVRFVGHSRVMVVGHSQVRFVGHSRVMVVGHSQVRFRLSRVRLWDTSG
jgi:hypothetical protein